MCSIRSDIALFCILSSHKRTQYPSSPHHGVNMALQTAPAIRGHCLNTSNCPGEIRLSRYVPDSACLRIPRYGCPWSVAKKHIDHWQLHFSSSMAASACLHRSALRPMAAAWLIRLGRPYFTRHYVSDHCIAYCSRVSPTDCHNSWELHGSKAGCCWIKAPTSSQRKAGGTIEGHPMDKCRCRLFKFCKNSAMLEPRTCNSLV